MIICLDFGLPCLEFKLDSPGFLAGRFDVDGWELELWVRCERRRLEDILPSRCTDRECQRLTYLVLNGFRSRTFLVINALAEMFRHILSERERE